jgi:hypothetical protein
MISKQFEQKKREESRRFKKGRGQKYAQPCGGGSAEPAVIGGARGCVSLALPHVIVMDANPQLSFVLEHPIWESELQRHCLHTSRQD